MAPDGRRRGRHPGRAGLATALPGDPGPDRRRDAPGRLPRGRGRPRRGARPGDVLLARDRRARRSAVSTARSSGRSPTSIGSPRTTSTSSAAGRAASSTCRPSATSSGSSPPAGARSSWTRSPSSSGRHDPRRLRGRRGHGRARPRVDRRRPRASPARRPAHRPTELPGTGPRWPSRSMIVTLFPAMLEGPLAESIPARIQERGLATIRVHDLRDWGLGRHRTVDDTPYGGGAGMVLRPEPVAAALASLRRPESTVVLLDPGGGAVPPGPGHATWRAVRHLVFLCPRYEGVDERIRTLVDLELSIGDYVLTGGELPGARRHRCGPPPAPGRDRRRLDGRGVVRRRDARVPPVHPAGGLRRTRCPGGPDQRRPRRRQALASSRGAPADASSGGPTSSPSGRSRPTSDRSSTSSRARSAGRRRPADVPIGRADEDRPSGGQGGRG